jgi:RNA polymerase sigma factor (sigma-70 family)
MGALADAYWRPIYTYVRLRWKREPEEARDLTQSFFLRALEMDIFASFDPSKARFRTFLRVCLDRFVTNETKAESRLKRGGEFSFVPMDFDIAERGLGAAAADDHALERAFDEEWVRALFTRSIAALEADCLARGRERVLRVFQRYDLADPPESRPSYAALGEALGVPVTTITNDLATARRELRRIVLAKLRELTASDEEFREESRWLFGPTSEGAPHERDQ